jgi:hypothetical protein
MKIGGILISNKPHEEILVLPRGTSQIVIRAQAILDLDIFDTLCPSPKPPGKLTKDGFIPDNNDETYRQTLARHNEKRTAYMVIKSLEPSNIEWDSVDIDNPKTWINYINDFRTAGFSSIEINRIVATVMSANALDESKLEQARKLFLAGQAKELEEFLGPSIEPQSSLSGELAKDSV